jgi:hypothetical protein
VLPWLKLAAGSGGFRLAHLPNTQRIDFSVGSFDSPNRPEAQAGRYLLQDLQTLPAQKRPLLVVTGQSAPSRRFLRGLARTSPTLARRFVVVTGDAIPFNTIYRDRQVAWPIQDLPFSLVFFCHHDPTDKAAGFHPHDRGSDEPGTASATGTEDVLLYADIVEAVALAQPAANPDALAEGLATLHVGGARLHRDGTGTLLFNEHGNRQSAGGEHVVCLRPVVRDERVLPEATIEVWTWRTRPGKPQQWEQRRDPLHVTYDEAP